MISIRRIYLYTVALISLETVIWGAIRLARTAADLPAGAGPSSLAGSLSLLLVGIPVFGLHWWWAQRDAARHPEERSTWARAFFLHGTLFITLVPAVQNLLALLNRALFSLFGLDPARAFIGGRQSFWDNAAAVLLNLAAAGLVFLALRSDWVAGEPDRPPREAGHIHQDLWLLYSLGLGVLGVQNLLRYVLGGWGLTGTGAAVPLANGLALLAGGLPLWYQADRAVKRAFSAQGEPADLPRLRILYAVALVAAIGVLPSLGLGLYRLLRVLLGVGQPAAGLLAQLNLPLSLALPLGAVWAYYSFILRAEIHRPTELPGPPAAGRAAAQGAFVAGAGFLARFRRTARLARSLPLPGRAGLRRLYYYTLALLGLGAVFLGLYLLLRYLVDLLLSGQVVWGEALPNALAGGLAGLLAGMPFWLFAWLPVQFEAVQDNEHGEHARRSLVRRGYLFLLCFLFLLGLLISAGALLFQLLTALLGDPPLMAEVELAQRLGATLLFAVFLAYHWRVLLQDGRLAERVLSRRRALYPVLILAPEEGDFGEQVITALEREAAGLPIAVHYYEQGVPDETLSAARAVILPADLITRPSEALRLWLQNFDGPRLVVPTPANGWHWVSAGSHPAAELARRAAHQVRHLAEGEAHAHAPETTAWTVIVHILAGLFALEILAGVIFLIASAMGVL